MTIQWSTALTTALLTGLFSLGASGCGEEETTPTGLSASTGSQSGTGGGQGGTGHAPISADPRSASTSDKNQISCRIAPS